MEVDGLDRLVHLVVISGHRGPEPPGGGRSMGFRGAAVAGGGAWLVVVVAPRVWLKEAVCGVVAQEGHGHGAEGELGLGTEDGGDAAALLPPGSRRLRETPARTRGGPAAQEDLLTMWSSFLAGSAMARGFLISYGRTDLRVAGNRGRCDLVGARSEFDVRLELGRGGRDGKVRSEVR